MNKERETDWRLVRKGFCYGAGFLLFQLTVAVVVFIFAMIVGLFATAI